MLGLGVGKCVRCHRILRILASFVVPALLSLVSLASSPAFGENSVVDQSGLPTLEQEKILRASGPVATLTWSSDSTKLAAAIIDAGPPVPAIGFRTGAFGNLIMVWEADGRLYRELRRKEPFLSVGSDIAFVAGDRQLVAPAMYSSNALAFSVFDLQSGEIVREIAGPAPDGKRSVNRAFRLVSLPDQQSLAVAFQGDRRPVALYSTHDWSKLADLPDASKAGLAPRAVASTSDGRFLAVVRGATAFIYEIASKQIVQKIGPTFESGYGLPHQVALSPDGSMVALALKRIFFKSTGAIATTDEDAVGIFSTRNSSRLASRDHVFSVNGLAWSPNGGFLAFTSGRNTVHLWDVLKSSPNERTRESNHARALALSPDGLRAAVSDGENVRIFRIVK